MGGETSNGGNEVVMVMSRSSESNGRFAYNCSRRRGRRPRSELQDAADAGFEFRAQTVSSPCSRREVIRLLERDKTPPRGRRTSSCNVKTSTLQKELQDVGAIGYQVIGMTVAKTAIGGRKSSRLPPRAPVATAPNSSRDDRFSLMVGVVFGLLAGRARCSSPIRNTVATGRSRERRADGAQDGCRDLSPVPSRRPLPCPDLPEAGFTR